jgi:glycosyltransferase involved in cell wall biosynthesis
LIIHLEKIDTINDYVIFLRKENWNDFEPHNPKFKKVLADIGWYGWKEQFFLSKIIKKEGVNLMHFPHWNVPIFYHGDFVVTVHDLLLLHFPTHRASTLGPVLYWLKNKLFRITLNRAVKKAKKIFTISEFTKQDIIQTLKISKEKIITTYLSPFSQKLDEEPPFSVYQKYEINKPYWLYVGVAYPHKNLEKLVDAWEIFCKQHDHTYHLVLSGKKNYFYNQLEKYIEKKKIKDIILTDFVPDAELPELYRNASLYVFPSLYEGFGLPPLEAMQYDLPVIASERTCLPEILEEAAVYFNPEDAHAITSAANLVIKDKDTRTKLINQGQKILKKYSWENTAKQTLEIYQSAQ